MSADYSQLVTAVIPTSPIPAHPSTDITAETIASIRHHFPGSRIVLLCDGVRPELEHRHADYDQYLRSLTENVLPDGSHIILHSRHRHQAAMMKELLEDNIHIETPLLLWCEHDLPIRTDVPTDWPMIVNAIQSGSVDLMRLMLMESIHPEHQHLMLGELPEYPHLIRTRQWSGWTHLASVAMYRRLLERFDARARIMVERYAVGVVESVPWEQYKLSVYIPDPDAARRIYHLHGRKGVNGQPDDPHYAEQECYPPR